MQKEAAFKLMFCAGWVYRMARRHAHDNGARFTQLMILTDLKLLGKLSPKDIADIEQVRRPTISAAIRDMEADGLVKCSPDPDDGRGTIVEITKKGRTLVQTQGDGLADTVAELIGDMPNSSLRKLNSGLGALQDRLLSQLDRNE